MSPPVHRLRNQSLDRRALQKDVLTPQGGYKNGTRTQVLVGLKSILKSICMGGAGD